MKTIICAVLFIIGISFNPLQAAEVSLPLPSDAVKTSEKNVDSGISQSNIQIYKTSLSKERILALYKKELTREGWSEQKTGLYSKDGYMAIIVVAPRVGKDKKTQFSLTTTKIPPKEELLALKKEVPDKIDFMPVCPDSKQKFLFNTPTGVSVSYETTKSVNETIFFFKSAMLSYGWKLASETPVTTNIADCPECQKAAGKSSGDEIKLTTKKANLTFRKSNGESCVIRLYQSIAGISEIVANQLASEKPGLDLAFNKTTILVTYNGNKKISQ